MDANDASSPGSLSSPPHSPEQGTPNSTVQVSTGGNGVGGASTPTPGNATSPAPRGLTASGQPRKKPGPKPKPKDPNVPEPEKKTRKPRKPAEPKDANAPQPAQRKRRTKASLDAQATPAPEVIDEKPPVQQSPAPQIIPSEPVPLPVPVPQPEQSSVVTQTPRVLSNPEPTLHSNPNLSHISVAPSTPRPSSSGQHYDPIRGGVFESKPQAPANALPPPTSPPLNRASASPSITSLIDPPSTSHSFYSHPAKLQQQASVTSAPVSPAAFHVRPGLVLPSQDFSPQPQQQVQPQLPPQAPQPYPVVPPSMAMEIDCEPLKQVSVPMAKTTSNHSATPSHSNAPTPPAKPARQKEAPPPLPTGSGLLSGTPFGPIASANGASETQGTNIWLTFNLKGQKNVTINFAQEVESKYGFAALHPRIAARRERQRQINAAGAALEKAGGTVSNDDMSVDLSENESNVEMGGMDDETSARENGKKRRKRKQEDYDKEDDFIDDTELAWEQQALMAKDGFFVYSGPLVTEEKPAVERSAITRYERSMPLTLNRADGTTKRGRGRGRGGTVRGDAAGRGRGRGGGPGSRGGSTVRKPRVTKADRAMMEQEKKERESLAATMAAKQPMTATAYPVQPSAT